MNLAAQLEHLLPLERLSLLHQASLAAQAQGVGLWVVGGVVRDLLLGRPNTDLDLVVEGDAIRVASDFAATAGGHLTAHEAFGTATVQVGSIALDFVTARTETYPLPAVLPVVTPAAIQDDVWRRDFTINTLALSLSPDTWGDVLDLCNGQRDIEAEVIRVLHDRSFIDDPTRILRGARFAGRLGYTIEPHTRSLMAAATPYFAQTTPIRLLNELHLLICEPAAERALAWLAEVGACEGLLVQWDADRSPARFEAVRQTDLGPVNPEVVVFGLLAPGDPRWLRHYPLTAVEQRLWRQVAEAQKLIPYLRSPLGDGTLDQLLSSFDAAALWVVHFAEFEDAHLTAHIRHYLADLRPTTTLLNGSDLRRLGFTPGPRFRQLLAELRMAQIDGLVADQAAAEAWLLARR